MHYRSLILAALMFPTIALAEDTARAPIVLDASKPATATTTTTTTTTVTTTTSAPAANGTLPSNFPAWAVTQVGEKTTGQHVDTPATPASPAGAPAAPTANAAPTAVTPASPVPPKSPISKLWPRDTVQIFLPPCANFHVELIPVCTCVITNLMVKMPHDEFLAESESGSIESDPRLIQVRQDCVSKPKQKE